jgi:hypothetical protein
MTACAVVRIRTVLAAVGLSSCFIAENASAACPYGLQLSQ